MRVILDTDHLSVLQWNEEPACSALLKRLGQISSDDVSTTIITFQEQIQGGLAYLKRAKKSPQIVRAYERIELVRQFFVDMNVMQFDDVAQDKFKYLRKRCPRVQTLDLRIASICLATKSTLLTRNIRDFRQVSGLDIQNWTKNSG